MEIIEQPIRYSKLLQNLSCVGFLAIDRRLNVTFWNRFMELHSHIKSKEIINRKLTGYFPDINEEWLLKKVKRIFILDNQSSTSWEQRSYLMKLPSSHCSMDDVDFMYQNCSYFPVKDNDNKTVSVGIIIHDVTEVALTQRLLENVTNQAIDLQDDNTHDFLTGLYNKQFFFDQLSQDASRCRQLDWGLTVAMIDADHFKSINDQYGHQGGDIVLKELATRLQSTLRASDSLCRYGGEEFVLILPNIDSEQAVNVCNRIRECVFDKPILYENHEIIVSVSVGISYLEKDKSLEKMIGEADEALYLAKNNGRNRVEEYREQLM